MLGTFVFARLRETKLILLISNALFHSLVKDVEKDIKILPQDYIYNPGVLFIAIPIMIQQFTSQFIACL